MNNPSDAAGAVHRRKRPDKAPRRDRADWLDTARRALIGGGVGQVKIEPLASVLGVTTGSFYHHFKNRQELLDGLLTHWETCNSKPLFEAVRGAGSDPDAQLDALFDAWVDEQVYDPAYDSAVRDWARTAPGVEVAVRRVDERRIELLQRIFEGLGYDAERAFIRARITYFHQVGYQAMEIIEPRDLRQRLRPLYREALVGTPPEPGS
jgi:AcrR family transcriptional regulator